jgi:hypothetical protein
MTTAEELQSKYNEFPAEIVDALVDEWSVKKVVVVGDNDDDPAFVFEDGSSISKGERTAYPPSRPFAELNDEEKEAVLRKLRARVREDENDVKFLKSLGVTW